MNVAAVRSMRASVLLGPRSVALRTVPRPDPAPGEALVAVRRVGVCGTDAEFFEGTMAYLHSGHASYPMRLGHEWSGVVAGVGDPSDESWVGRSVIGDTMLGCGSCERCRTGRAHVCADRAEVGIRSGRDGALAEYLVVPVSSLHAIPDGLSPTVGALVEPGGNAVRAVRAVLAGPGRRVLILGTGTIGLLAAMFARAEGAEVHLLGRPGRDRAFERDLGFTSSWTRDDLPDLSWDAVIEASTAAELPALAAQLVEPGGRIALIGLSGEPSLLDTRDLVLGDVTAVGILSGSHGLDEAIEAYASGRVDPTPLVAATVPLSGVADVLAGRRPAGAGPGPKIHVDPSLPDAVEGNPQDARPVD